MIFRQRQFIVEFVHHNKPHPVAQVKKTARGVMRISDGVDAVFSEFGQTTLPDGGGNRRTERASVVMKAGAFDLEIAPVHPETARRVEMKFANAEGNGLLVKRVAVRAKVYDGFVEIAFSYIPKLRGSDAKHDSSVFRFIGPDRCRRTFERSDLFPGWIEDVDLH